MPVSTSHNKPMKGIYSIKKQKKLRNELVDEILSLTKNRSNSFNEKPFLELQTLSWDGTYKGNCVII